MEAKLVLVLSFAAFLLLTSVHATDIEYCDAKQKYPVTVKDVVISPHPVKPGRTTTFTISASTDKPFSGGEMAIDVNYIGIDVDSEKFDLCDKAKCPVSVGDFEVSHKQKLPFITPPGTYYLTMKMTDGKGEEMTCFRFSFSISWWAVADM